jgi:hypothetical protein
LVVGQGHALPASWASGFAVRSKPPPLRRLRQRDSKDGWQGMALPHEGPGPRGGKIKWH